MLKEGIYEKLINKELSTELKVSKLDIGKEEVDKAEASKILARYMATIMEKSLKDIFSESENDNAKLQVDLMNKIIKTIESEISDADYDGYTIDDPAELLTYIIDHKNTAQAIKKNKSVTRPVTSLSESSLFTGAKHEPKMFSEIEKEIATSDRVDFLVSFFRWSGLRLIIENLRDFTDSGGQLRIITTSYMGATEPRCLEELLKLKNTTIKVSYDTQHTRLHAKTYIFHRETGYTTAYVGSSNMSRAALTDGLEWNVKVTNQDLPYTIDKITATFEQYWNMKDFETLDENNIEKFRYVIDIANDKEKELGEMAFFDIQPYQFQQEILDKLQAERVVRGRYENLIVAATGTGKTVISAFDYKRFKKEMNDKSKLLFVAHREEILKQSLFTFRNILRDQNFGELFVGSHKPESLNNLFISIQTLNSSEFIDKVDKDFYDYIIVDEFHHAAAKSYDNLLNHFEPKILLGLTATPERMDGKSILKYFDDRIAAEIRLPEAIERSLLVSFHYFGVTDDTDISQVKWLNGGYDKRELSNIYTMDELRAHKRAGLIHDSVKKYVSNVDDVKGLGFCVSKEHARFMANAFNKAGIPSKYLTSDSDKETRDSIQRELVTGEIKFIFVVDLYNEGVDIPAVNTVLFLRPTESLTVFLQQLGRGLRIHEDKECLTVLDFVAQAHKKYRFEDRFQALLGNTETSVTKEIKDGFPSAPKGCYIQLERVAKKYILDNIKSSFNDKSGLIYRLESFEEDSGLELNLSNFLEHYHLDKRQIYKKYCFSRLCVEAKVRDDFNEEIEEIMTKAFYRISSIDSRRFLNFLLNTFENLETMKIDNLKNYEKRMLNMFQFTIWQKSFKECGFTDELEGCRTIKSQPVMYSELMELLSYNYSQIDFVDEPVDLGFESPLDLYCQYTRDQLLVGMDYFSPSTMQMGVKEFRDKNVMVLLVTLNKSDKEYSPTTMYEDYSIDENLFHWQSQSMTSPESRTGQKYINHKSAGIKIALFVREYKKDIYGVTPYTFLGTVNYLKHEGSKPMSIIWRLDKPIPAKFLKKSNKLVVG